MPKHLKKIAKYLLLLIPILIIAGYFAYHRSINIPLAPNNQNLTTFQISKGESLKKIASNLKEKNLIRSELAFYIFTRTNHLDTKFKAGRFTISPSMNVPEITELLTSAKQGNVVITIQEGHTASDINQNLKSLGLIKNQEFIEAINAFKNFEQYSFLNEAKSRELPVHLEGYLFPDTYFIDPSNFTPESFIETLLNTFEQKALPLINSSNQSHTTDEIITMASIVEKEAYGPKDSPLISGILWKRNDNGWFLGADATSLYQKDINTITHETLQEKSPYNTRNFTKGLPPGPIGNPGLESIKATLNPEESEYWYYLHDQQGQTHFAKTNDEHNLNKARYLQ